MPAESQTPLMLTREPRCPKHMVFGPCGGVRPDLSCEMAAHRCPFTERPTAPRWAEPPPERPAPSALLEALRTHPVVVTDLTLPAYDAEAVARITAVLAGSCDALLVGEHQNRPDFPPTLMAALIRQAGGTGWLTLTCRDRNRLVLEQDLIGLRIAGADGVLCVTGDGRAEGVRPGVTQVFDLDGTRLAGLAASLGVPVAVPEAPAAPPRSIRPARLLQKQRAGAQLAFLNHAGSVAELAGFVRACRDAGVTIPLIAGVAVYTDPRSAQVLQNFPGLQLDPEPVARVLAADDPVVAGIDAAVTEAHELLALEGIAGVNLSGLASGRGEYHAAEVKAEIGRRIRSQS
ncbi:MAG TPA: methylenetetrahydrofolate reductase [Jatrophihabitans sp.]|jgi:5,10-methylenetetrahydrofolate reductase|uniref:methylenetetrahydrofolate reductase n=1 Tax=Jatrophihabitans sp. TaxID=1932789 RepID=UPI002EDCD7A8